MTRRSWREAVLAERRQESDSAHTLVLEVDGWPNHLPGQHLDLRLTAADGYQATRSYSLAAPLDQNRVEITVQRAPGGEVSPFLTDVLAVGDVLEVRGPIGGWFVWRPDEQGAVLLVGGGSGLVPLMAMVRSRPRGSAARFRLICSVRTPNDRLYAAELEDRAAQDEGLEVTWIYTRSAPAGHDRRAGRLTSSDVRDHGWQPEVTSMCFVCGPTGFVESTATLLLAAGHDPALVRTERFGNA
jgi:ferredoxin-NADP reductase